MLNVTNVYIFKINCSDIKIFSFIFVNFNASTILNFEDDGEFYTISIHLELLMFQAKQTDDKK